MYDNLDAYKAGEHIPHIISKPFMETFTVGLGGSGMTLAVVIIMAFIMKKNNTVTLVVWHLVLVSLTLMNLLSLVCQSF